MKTLLLGLSLVLLAVDGLAQAANMLQGMAAKYDAKLVEIGQIRDKAANEALTELNTLLDSLEKKYAAKGHLDGVLSVKKVKERLVSPDVQIPDEAIPASGPLSDILKLYVQKKNQAGQTHRGSMGALIRAYLSALDRLKAGYTKQSKIEEAMSVSIEIERITELEPELVAEIRGEAAALTASAATQSRNGSAAALQKPAGPTAGKPWTSPTGIDFVYIPPGTFMMGSPASEEGRREDETQHRVTLTKGYWLGKYEVTQAQWEAVMGGNPSFYKGADLPVEQVSWNDCQEFIRKLCEKEGVPQGTYGLPTEAEWEYACRAGTTGMYAGNLDDLGWYGNNSGRSRMDAKDLWDADRATQWQKINANGCSTHGVAGKSPNAWGLYDMHGNVREWSQGWFGAYPSGNVTDPTGPGSGSSRSLRGGSWSHSAGICRSADRGVGLPNSRASSLGFRLLKTE